MKKLMLVAAVLGISTHSFATMCAGELNSGKIVTVEVTTWGTVGAFGTAEVAVYEKDGTKLSGYLLNSDEEAQFAEDYDSEGTRANPTQGSIVLRMGVSFPMISLNYRGLDYIPFADFSQRNPIFDILLNPKRRKQQGNYMKVWKGGDHKPSEVYEFKDIVCMFEQDV